MQEVTPSEDAIKAYLGENLFNEYQREETENLPYGVAHMRLQVVQHRIRVCVCDRERDREGVCVCIASVCVYVHTHTHTLQVGQHRIRKIANFKKAYGGKTEFEWCLEQHKNDRKLFLT